MKVLREGIPGWQQRGYPMEGPRRGAIEHRPYPAGVRELEQRLRTTSLPREAGPERAAMRGLPDTD